MKLRGLTFIFKVLIAVQRIISTVNYDDVFFAEIVDI